MKENEQIQDEIKDVIEANTLLEKVRSGEATKEEKEKFYTLINGYIGFVYSWLIRRCGVGRAERNEV